MPWEKIENIFEVVNMCHALAMENDNLPINGHKNKRILLIMQ